MNERGDGMDDLLAQQGRTEEELYSTVGNAMESPEIWKKNSNIGHEPTRRREHLRLCSNI